MTHPKPVLPVARILNPESVAVIGASDDLRKFGARVFDNIRHGGFTGRCIPINPKRAEVGGVEAFASIADVGGAVDVAVIAVPIEYVEAAVTACAERGVGCCVVITAGFSEMDEQGAQAQARLVEIARRKGMRLIGPNCLGFINSHADLLCNSSPAMKVTPFKRGGIGHASQSGALMATTYNRGVDDGAYFSSSVSVGNQADLELADFIEYFAQDPNTRVVTLYVEGFRDPSRFVAAVELCRAAGKPVLMVKSGLTQAGARVTRSHTASLASSAAVIEAICREAGVILVNDARGMMQAAELISRHGIPTGDGICVLSGSGGAAAITADRMSEMGLRLSEFSPQTRTALEEIFEPTQLGNPLDVGALKDKSFVNIDDGGLSIAAADDDVHAILLPITTAPMIGEVTRCTAQASIDSGKPALFVIIQGSADDGARVALRELDVLHYETMDEALRVLDCWMRAGRLGQQTSICERPGGLPCAADLVDRTYAQLTEPEVKTLVSAYGIPVNRETVVQNLDAGLHAADEIGYPVVLKAVSRELVHKSDVGAVHLDLADAQDLREAWRLLTNAVGMPSEGCLIAEMAESRAEMIVGLKYDNEFGPMVVFGLGGTVAELIADVCVAPAPISSKRALELLAGLQLWPLLNGARGQPPLDVGAVADIISRVSWLGSDAGKLIAELDLNPVLVGIKGAGALAVDGVASLDLGDT